MLYLPPRLTSIASRIFFCFLSVSEQRVVRKARTFSKINTLGLISSTSFIDSTTREFRANSSPFLWLATDIPWHGGVANKTSISFMPCLDFQRSTSENIFSCVVFFVMSSAIYPLGYRHLLLCLCTSKRL